MKPVIISGHNIALTDAIKDLTTEKFNKLFRHNPGILRARVEFLEERDNTSPGKLRFTARARLEIEGPDLVASADSGDLYKSIDLLVRKLDGQIRRKHGSTQAKRKDALAA